MRKLLLLTFILLPSAAFPQTLESKISACRAIAQDEDRLKCFDEIMPPAASNPAPPAASAPARSAEGRWSVSERTHPLDDSKLVTLLNIAESGTGYPSGGPVTMIIRCQRNRTELYINWKSYLSSEGGSVDFRVGAEPARRSRWDLSTDSEATFSPDPIGTIRRMMAAERVVAQATPYRGSPITAIFNTRGLAEAIKPLQAACNWS